MKKRSKILLVVVLFILITTTIVFGRSKKSNEKRFQLGFGFTVSTNNLLGLIEDVRMTQAIDSGSSYDYPGLSTTQKAALNDIDVGMRRAIMIANILGGMEYGLQMRILWSALMMEMNLNVIPLDGSYNGRLDLRFQFGIGLRAPFFIMPYILVGATANFSFYPGEVQQIEDWRTYFTNNFALSPGIDAKIGLDLKFKKWSIGAYYLYSIRDFKEFTDWWGELWNNLSSGDTQAAQNQAWGMIVAAQSKFGASLCFYLF